MLRKLLSALSLSLGLALAHGGPTLSIPSAGAVVRQVPGEVTLLFPEPLVLQRSAFRVYALEANPALPPARLRQAAADLAGRVLGKADTKARADTGLRRGDWGPNAAVIGLKKGLKPGVYAVMWKAVTADGASSSGSFYFIYRP